MSTVFFFFFFLEILVYEFFFFLCHLKVRFLLRSGKKKTRFFVALYGDENPYAQGISNMENIVSVFICVLKTFKIC